MRSTLDPRARRALRRCAIAVVVFAGVIDALMRNEPAYESPYVIVTR